MDVMGWLAWIIVGAVAGWLASSMMHSPLSLIGDIMVGVVGAFVAGFMFSLAGAPGATGFNIWSLFVAFVGAVVLLGAIRLINGNRGLNV